MGNNLKKYFFLILLFGCLKAYGQQYPQFTQFMLNKYALNPGYGGLEQSLSITAAIRTQWSQFEGAPKTQLINAHLPMYKLNGSLGVAIENEQLGALKRTQATASYNYVYDSPFGLFSFGLRAGIQQIRLNSSQLRTPSGSYFDQSIDHNDPLLTGADLDGLAPVWGWGFYMVYDQFEFGLGWDNMANNSVVGASSYRISDLMTILVSYEYFLSDMMSITPSLLVKSDLTQTQTDLGGILKYQNYFGGLTIRGYNSNSLDALNIIVGAKVSEHLRISYSFDVGLSNLRTFHDGSHEFGVNYNLNKKIKTGELPKIIYNPRYN